MATATKVRATWQERALFLMEEARRKHDGLAWRNTHVVARSADGTPSEITVDVESTSMADVWYTVHYFVREDSARCPCRAGSFVWPCGHAGRGIWYGRSVAAQYTPAARADSARMLMRDLAHEHVSEMMRSAW